MVWLLDPSALNEYMLFYKQRFFNSASVLLTFLINWASNVAYVWLNTYKHHHPKTFLIFTLFVSMSRRRPVYILSVWSIFNLYLYFYRHTSSFIYFLEYVLLFFDDNVDEECKQFSNSRSLAIGCCLTFAWFFGNFRLALLIKVLPIKKCVIHLHNYLFPVNVTLSLMLASYI